MNRRQFICGAGQCALTLAASTVLPPCLNVVPAYATGRFAKGAIGKKLSPYFTPLGDKAVQCNLCPHQCEVSVGERGICEVRENVDGKYYSLVYGNPCAVHVDPIEKKPFYHVLPTTKAFSIATAGCNFDCKFCQNWEISQARPEETFNYMLPPDEVVASALRYKCQSIASTYVEPTVFMEYVVDIAQKTKSKPLLKIMHSNGFVNKGPLKELCRYLDGACIDLKGFTEDYYQNVTEGRLEPVLETLRYLRSQDIHTELVTLLVPGKNDDTKEIELMCRWIKKELGPDTPLHFSRFYPRYKLKSITPTPISTLERARQTAMDIGLNYVYLGNVPEHPGGNTYCPKCKKMLIKRIGYHVKVLHLKNGLCFHCDHPIHGIWKLPDRV